MTVTLPPDSKIIAMLIRPYLAGEEQQLRQIFLSSVHKLACQYYSVDQLKAWAPEVYDRDVWRNRISMLKPFVAVVDGQLVAYADLQETGYIDHFLKLDLYCCILSSQCF